jgi:zinc D-Ala-D-Ala carboxypeptidase
MQLSTHFTLSEFCYSVRAQELGIHNEMEDSRLLEAAQRTCCMMEKIRLFLTVQRGRDVPITCLSGYRSPELNRVTPGSMISSDHMRGAAMDWAAPSFADTTTIAKLLAPRVDELGIGQVILEYPGTDASWIHCSTIRPMLAVNRIMTHMPKGYYPGIKEN